MKMWCRVGLECGHIAAVTLVALVAVAGLPPQAGAEGTSSATSASTGAPARTADGEEDGPDGPPPMADKQIIDYQMWRLSQDLQLSDADAARVFPRMRKLGEAQSEMRRDRMKLLKKLRSGLDQASPDELHELVRQIRDTEVRRMENVVDLEDSVHLVLSPRQQAQYLVSRESFLHDLHRMAEEARGRRFDGGRPPRVGGRPGGMGRPGGLPSGGFPGPGPGGGGPREHR